MHGRFLGTGRATREPDVGRDQVFFVVGMSALVLGHQPASAGVGAVVEEQPVHVLVTRVLVLVVLVLELVVVGLGVLELIRGLVRFLFGQQLVPGLALGLLLLRGAGSP